MSSNAGKNGIKNPLNDCFINSVLQLVLKIKPLSDYICQNDDMRRSQSELLKETYQIFH